MIQSLGSRQNVLKPEYCKYGNQSKRTKYLSNLEHHTLKQEGMVIRPLSTFCTVFDFISERNFEE